MMIINSDELISKRVFHYEHWRMRMRMRTAEELLTKPELLEQPFAAAALIETELRRKHFS